MYRGRNISDELDLVNILHLVTISASELRMCGKLVDYGEICAHGLIVGYALRVVAFHDTYKIVGERHCLLLYNLIITYDV